MATRLAAENTAHATSSTRGLYGQWSPTTRIAARRTPASRREPLSALPGHELIALTSHRLDQVEAELGAQPPDAHVHHVRTGVEIVTPDGSEQRAFRHGVAHMLSEFAQ